MQPGIYDIMCSVSEETTTPSELTVSCISILYSIPYMLWDTKT